MYINPANKDLQELKNEYENFIREAKIDYKTNLEKKPKVLVEGLYNSKVKDHLIDTIYFILEYCNIIDRLFKKYKNSQKGNNFNNGNLLPEEIEKIIIYDRTCYEWSINFLLEAFNILGLEEAKEYLKKDMIQVNMYWYRFIRKKKLEEGKPIKTLYLDISFNSSQTMRETDKNSDY